MSTASATARAQSVYFARLPLLRLPFAASYIAAVARRSLLVWIYEVQCFRAKVGGRVVNY